MDTVHYFAFICCAMCVVSVVENVKIVLPLECALVLCAAPECDDSFIPPGECCPVCKGNMKQGQCPVAPKGINTLCLEECQGDDSCPGDQKCCRDGCHFCTNPVGKSCNYKGSVYKDGARFKDKCNTCRCSNGAVLCTKMGCLGGKPCIYNGKTYQEGEIFNVDCNTCTCRHGLPLCTHIACQDKPGTCPILPPGTIGPCVSLCGSDSECPGPQKCCSNGCGSSCDNPAREELPTDPKDPCKRCTCTGGKVKSDSIVNPACACYRPPGACCNFFGAKPPFLLFIRITNPSPANQIPILHYALGDYNK